MGDKSPKQKSRKNDQKKAAAKAKDDRRLVPAVAAAKGQPGKPGRP